ncbi:MAG: IS4 family transposase, partial [Terriglobia bacterium]
SIGAFKQAFPIGNVKTILKQTGKASIRERLLPNHVVVYYVMAMALMMTASYREVMRWLLEGSKTLKALKVPAKPMGKSGISQARERLGWEPFKRLYEQFVQPIATAATQGASYNGWRLVSIDGSSIDVADTPENDKEFGRQVGSRGKKKSAFPKLRFASLIENGTRVLFGMDFGPYATTSEMDLAWRVIKSLKEGMLCLADRYYFSYHLWQSASQTKAHLLWRVKTNLILEPEKFLPDGSYLATVYKSSADRKQKKNGIQVRVIEYKFKWIRGTGTYRLITTILDYEKAPADELAAVYHERWEIETALGECKTKLKGSTVMMRSKTPELVKQEFYGFMLTYFVIRKLMHEAALQAGEDPDRLSFKHTIQIIRRKIHLFRTFPPAALA